MVHDNHGLKRSLQPRHIRLMALGSTIGVGLFLGSATAIQLAGPSIILGYILAGLVAFIVLRAFAGVKIGFILSDLSPFKLFQATYGYSGADINSFLIGL